MVHRVRIGGFDYRLAKHGKHGLQTYDFMKGSLNYKQLRRMACRNPILPDGPPTERGPYTSPKAKAVSILREFMGTPDGPTRTRQFSAFTAACLIITQMAGLEELDMELEHCTRSAKPDIIRVARYEMNQCVIPQLEKLCELKLHKFNVTFTKNTLWTMSWTRQPFENGIRRKAKVDEVVV
jgi:hypothetical protein